MPYTDWDVDTDVSLHMHRGAMIEKGITQVGDTFERLIFASRIIALSIHIRHNIS